MKGLAQFAQTVIRVIKVITNQLYSQEAFDDNRMADYKCDGYCGPGEKPLWAVHPSSAQEVRDVQPKIGAPKITEHGEPTRWPRRLRGLFPAPRHRT